MNSAGDSDDAADDDDDAYGSDDDDDDREADNGKESRLAYGTGVPAWGRHKKSQGSNVQRMSAAKAAAFLTTSTEPNTAPFSHSPSPPPPRRTSSISNSAASHTTRASLGPKSCLRNNSDNSSSDSCGGRGDGRGCGSGSSCSGGNGGGSREMKEFLARAKLGQFEALLVKHGYREPQHLARRVDQLALLLIGDDGDDDDDEAGGGGG
mmetsp:Transcript_31450/g.63890  ORF Transcript_31450/g.63890 Transcript_31450/m.63890 type:complete len:208 (+) Transcript_31450:407-1030(+)